MRRLFKTAFGHDKDSLRLKNIIASHPSHRHHLKVETQNLASHELPLRYLKSSYHTDNKHIIPTMQSHFSLVRRKILRLYFPPAMLFFNT